MAKAKKKKMKKFTVQVREVHIQPYEIEAKDEQEAIAIVQAGGGEIIEGGFEYSHTLDSGDWTVEEVEK